MDLGGHGHEPVLLDAVLALLAPQPHQLLLDCTVGRGGHAEAILAQMRPQGRLIAMDADPQNLAYAKARLERFGPNCRFFHANFGETADVLAAANAGKVDMLLADLGVSTNQILGGKHGLSFAGDEPLDMRLDPRIARTAADLVATLSEKELADLIYHYSQEHLSRRIARKIVETRRTAPIATTGQLAELIRQVAPRHHAGQINPATRTFQALRMAVNQELESLASLLQAIPAFMAPGGRVAIISFHSGEDRLVKQAMRNWCDQGVAQRLTKKPVVAGDAELFANPRSRSAKLRVVRFADVNVSRPVDENMLRQGKPSKNKSASFELSDADDE